MGGAIRQSGIVAAGCLYALDHNVERLAEDHENARACWPTAWPSSAARWSPPETNIVIFAAPAGFAEAMGRRGGRAERHARTAACGP